MVDRADRRWHASRAMSAPRDNGPLGRLELASASHRAAVFPRFLSSSSSRKPPTGRQRWHGQRPDRLHEAPERPRRTPWTRLVPTLPYRTAREAPDATPWCFSVLQQERFLKPRVTRGRSECPSKRGKTRWRSPIGRRPLIRQWTWARVDSQSPPMSRLSTFSSYRLRLSALVTVGKISKAQDLSFR